MSTIISKRRKKSR